MNIINILFKNKRIKHCPICDKWFYDDSKFNKRKYCNKECYRKANIDKTNYNRDKKHFVIVGSDIESNRLQKQKDYMNRLSYEDGNLGFMEDDQYWGLGNSGLTENPRTDNWNKEYEYIKKEMKRLKLK